MAIEHSLFEVSALQKLIKIAEGFGLRASDLDPTTIKLIDENPDHKILYRFSIMDNSRFTDPEKDKKFDKLVKVLGGQDLSGTSEEIEDRLDHALSVAPRRHTR